jgi:hypothetical protein
VRYADQIAMGSWPVAKQVFPDTSWRTDMIGSNTVRGTADGVASRGEQGYILRSMALKAVEDEMQ